jgi:hypothetical protein
MSTEIERLLFYERQYLQSFDFTAEQTYHLEMRRRLNLALHLWGIAYGLELRRGEVVPGAPEQYYVSEGMAIDAYGRELIVSSKQLLMGDPNEGGITGEGVYSVWIGYKREPARPPKPGYRQCNLEVQFTRWKESFEVLVTRSVVDPNPLIRPDPAGSLPDDPKLYPCWIRLGTLIAGPAGTVTGVRNEERSYIGVRTQRIVAPRSATGDFDILKENAALEPLTSIAVKDNVFIEQNLIAGDDFKVDRDQIKPAPSEAFPNPTGNVKIASDLFLQGNLYTHGDPTCPEKWLNLDGCIQRQIQNLIPEIHIGTTKAPLTFPVASRVDATSSLTAVADVVVTTQLAKVANVDVTASLAGIHWKPRPLVVLPQGTGSHHPAAETTVPDVTGFHIETSAKLVPESGNTYRLTLGCTAGPAQQTSASPAAYEVPIDSVLISYVVVFNPSR